MAAAARARKVRILKPGFFAGVADEGGLHQYRGHGGAQQDVKGALADAQIANRAVVAIEMMDQRTLDLRRQAARFVDLGVGHQIEQNQLQVADLLEGGPVLAGGDFHRLVVLGEVQVVGLHPVGVSFGTGIGMQRDEQVGVDLVGDGGPLLEGDERIVVAGHDHLAAELLLEARGEGLGHRQGHVLFQRTAGADRSGVLAAVAGVDDDAQQLSAALFRDVQRNRTLHRGILQDF